jgi:hypothetical protein
LATVALRSRPQITGLSGVPLFLEAMTAAFEAIADVAVAALYGGEAG